jgi:hypothetical protein
MQPADIAPKDRLIVPLDLPGVAEAEAMIARLGDSVSFYKIGYQLAYAGGLPLAQQLTTSAIPSRAASRALPNWARPSSPCTPIPRP